jgi:hypothetical protein
VWADPNCLCFQVLRVEIQRERERQAQWARACVYVFFCLFESFPKIVQIPPLRDLLRNLWMIYGDEVSKRGLKGLWDCSSPHYHTNGLKLLSWFPLELWELGQWRYVSLVGCFLETSVFLMCVSFLCFYLFIVCIKKTLVTFAPIQFEIVCLHVPYPKKVKYYNVLHFHLWLFCMSVRFDLSSYRKNLVW